MRNAIKKLPLAVLLAVMTLSALGGIAAAVWSSVGHGTATASTGATVPILLTPATPTDTLFPGGQSDVDLTVVNPNAFTVRIGSLSKDSTRGTDGFSVDAGHAGCAVSALTFTTQTNGTTGWTVPGRVGSTDGTLAVTLANALAMDANALSACQGATFTVYLVAKP